VGLRWHAEQLHPLGQFRHRGGGARGGTLNNCMLLGNSAHGVSGGGAYGGTLNNCTLSGKLGL